MIEWFKTNVYNRDLECPCRVPVKCDPPCSYREMGILHQYIKAYIIDWWHWDGITCIRLGNPKSPQFIFGKSQMLGHRVLTLFGFEIL